MLPPEVHRSRAVQNLVGCMRAHDVKHKQLVNTTQTMADLGTLLAEPPSDGITSLQFAPGGSSLLLASSWDGVSGG